MGRRYVERLRPPTSRAEIDWTETTRSWHAVSHAALKRHARALCGTVAYGLYRFDADEYPEPPDVLAHLRVCETCRDRVASLPIRGEA